MRTRSTSRSYKSRRVSAKRVASTRAKSRTTATGNDDETHEETVDFFKLSRLMAKHIQEIENVKSVRDDREVYSKYLRGESFVSLRDAIPYLNRISDPEKAARYFARMATDPKFASKEFKRAANKELFGLPPKASIDIRPRHSRATRPPVKALEDANSAIMAFYTTEYYKNKKFPFVPGLANLIESPYNLAKWVEFARKSRTDDPLFFLLEELGWRTGVTLDKKPLDFHETFPRFLNLYRTVGIGKRMKMFKHYNINENTHFKYIPNERELKAFSNAIKQRKERPYVAFEVKDGLYAFYQAEPLAPYMKWFKHRSENTWKFPHVEFYLPREKAGILAISLPAKKGDDPAVLMIAPYEGSHESGFFDKNDKFDAKFLEDATIINLKPVN